MKQLMPLRLLACIMSVMLLSGCFKKRVEIYTTSFADKERIPAGFSKQSTFAIIPVVGENFTDGRSTLQTKEVADKMATAFAQKGFGIQKTLYQKPDYVVTFNYGLYSKTVVENRPLYIPGQTVTVQGNASTHGNAHAGYNSVHYNQNTQAYTTATSSGSWTYLPENVTYHTKGIFWQVYDAKEFEKWAYDTKQQPPSEVWHGAAHTVSTNADLRFHLDYLIIQLCRLFGNSTSNTSTIITEDDEDLMLMCKTYEDPNSIISEEK